MPTLHLTDQQLDVLRDALDLRVRIGLGQLWAVETHCHHLGRPGRASQIRLWDECVRLAAALQERPPHTSRGVGDPDLPAEVRIAYDLECVLRGQGRPLHLGPEPLATLHKADDD